MDSFRDILLDTPALPPPPGVTADLDHPRTHRAFALAVFIPCLSVTILMTLLRVYVKTFIERKWHVEDWLMIPAFLSSMAEYGIAIHVYTFAPVVHQWDMTIRTVIKFTFDFYIGALLSDGANMFLKNAILFQFIRLFTPKSVKKKSWYFSVSLIAVNTLFYIIVIFAKIFQCRPIKKAWDPLILEGKCLDTAVVLLSVQLLNVVIDLIILVWTQIIIWRLHMSTKQKLKVAIVFVAGAAAIAFGSVGIWTNVKILTAEDQAYWGAYTALFTFPECTSGFLVLCLPILPRLVKHTKAQRSTYSSGSAAQTPGQSRTDKSGTNDTSQTIGSLPSRRREAWEDERTVL